MVGNGWSIGCRTSGVETRGGRLRQESFEFTAWYLHGFESVR